MALNSLDFHLLHTSQINQRSHQPESTNEHKQKEKPVLCSKRSRRQSSKTKRLENKCSIPAKHHLEHHFSTHDSKGPGGGAQTSIHQTVQGTLTLSPAATTRVVSERPNRKGTQSSQPRSVSGDYVGAWTYTPIWQEQGAPPPSEEAKW